MREPYGKLPLSKVARIERGKFSARPRNDPKFYGGEIPFLQTGDIARAGRIIQGWTQTLNELGLGVSKMFPRGTIFMSIAANIGDVAISDFDAACPDSVVAVKPRNGFDHEWLFQSLKFSKNDLAALSTQNAQANLSLKKIEPFKVPVPPLPEQRKIAEILRTWDEALEKLTALRTAKQDRFTGLSQQIMGRGGVFPEQWPLKSLSAVSTPVRRKSAGDNHPVMTISAKSGFLMQSDKFARDMAGRSVERYTLLHEGEFAYNKGNSKTAPYGCVFRLDRPTALVPFVYYCFTLKSGLDPELYEHLFAAGALNHQLSRLINSGVRNDGLLNLYSDDFYSCRVPVPPIDEQRKIARALTAAKQELALIVAEIEALTRQKRGLMQKLLTGEWPVSSEKELV
jgi:type I restriction enzyme S subunit